MVPRGTHHGKTDGTHRDDPARSVHQLCRLLPALTWEASSKSQRNHSPGLTCSGAAPETMTVQINLCQWHKEHSHGCGTEIMRDFLKFSCVFVVDLSWSEHTMNRGVDTPACLAEAPCHSLILDLYPACHLTLAVKSPPHNELSGLPIEGKSRTEKQPLQGEKLSTAGRIKVGVCIISPSSSPYYA